MLREIAGQPLLGHVYQGVRASPLLADVIIATDSDEIMEVCARKGWKAQMTSSDHRSGTERVHEVSNSVGCRRLSECAGRRTAYPARTHSLFARCDEEPWGTGRDAKDSRASAVDVNNPNAVKGRDRPRDGQALYFSRATIPFDRDGSHPAYFKHLGFYAYRKPALDLFVRLKESSLERSERLEQLRFLENGVAIHVAETPHDTVGVDTEEDLRRVEQILLRKQL